MNEYGEFIVSFSKATGFTIEESIEFVTKDDYETTKKYNYPDDTPAMAAALTKRFWIDYYSDDE